MWEIFDPTDGAPLFRVPFLVSYPRPVWTARALTRLLHSRYPGGLDYAPAGEGWTSPVRPDEGWTR